MRAATERAGFQQKIVADDLPVHAGKHVPGKWARWRESITAAQAGTDSRHAEIRVQPLAEAERHADLHIVAQVAYAHRQGRQRISFERADGTQRQAPGPLMQ